MARVNARNEEAKFDANAGESYALARRFGARRNVVIPRKLPSLHPAAIVHNCERRLSRIGEKADARCARVKRIREHFGEDGLLESSRVRVAKIFQQVLEIDTRLPHARILSPGRMLEHATRESR